MNIGGHGSVIHLAPACIVAIWLSRFESTLIDDVVPVVGDRDESRKENNVSLKDRAGLLIGSLLDGLSLDMTMTREFTLPTLSSRLRLDAVIPCTKKKSHILMIGRKYNYVYVGNGCVVVTPYS